MKAKLLKPKLIKIGKELARVLATLACLTVVFFTFAIIFSGVIVAFAMGWDWLIGGNHHDAAFYLAMFTPLPLIGLWAWVEWLFDDSRKLAQRRL